jgi:hypothetical protein
MGHAWGAQSFDTVLDAWSVLQYSPLSTEDLFLAVVPMTEVNIICRFSCRARMSWDREIGGLVSQDVIGRYGHQDLHMNRTS